MRGPPRLLRFVALPLFSFALFSFPGIVIRGIRFVVSRFLGLGGACGRLPFVLIDLIGQPTGPIGDISLVLGEPRRIVAALGASLDPALLPQDSLDFLDVGRHTFLFFLQSVGPIFAQQQLQDLSQFVSYFQLA